MSTHVRKITPKQLHEICSSGKQVELIDVRTPGEFRSSHADIARSEPLSTLNPLSIISGRQLKDEPLYVICQSGTRSAKACAAFAAEGFGNVVVDVEGGTFAWAKAGLPLVKGRFVLPLDRQVRIAIGFLVLLGNVLGYLVSPWFYTLSAFCGAGLIFAGVTDICPLSMLISSMPWNQGSGEGQACKV
jgi:rhodanese-related sulfurtransferase